MIIPITIIQRSGSLEENKNLHGCRNDSDQPKGQPLVLYGRRRIGKTENPPAVCQKQRTPRNSSIQYHHRPVPLGNTKLSDIHTKPSSKIKTQLLPAQPDRTWVHNPQIFTNHVMGCGGVMSYYCFEYPNYFKNHTKNILGIIHLYLMQII